MPKCGLKWQKWIIIFGTHLIQKQIFQPLKIGRFLLAPKELIGASKAQASRGSEGMPLSQEILQI